MSTMQEVAEAQTTTPPPAITSEDPKVQISDPQIQESQSQEDQARDPEARLPTPPHLSHDPTRNGKDTKPFQFGQRYLTDTLDPFTYNAWDHVLPDSEHEAYCASQYTLQRGSPVSAFDYQRFNDNPEKWWNLFYKQKQNTFFKDRKWLRQEFPVLGEITQKGAGKKRVLEVGAGAGNTAFPILRNNENEELSVYAYDFSKTAVKTMREDEGYDERFMTAEVWDVASTENDGLPPGIEAESLDVVIMIFIFSALNPRQWTQAVKNIYRVLKPGGQVLFRDYGRGDLAQVRFKKGRYMEENFYVRGDGTRVYFFEKEELERIWGGGSRSSSSRDTTEHDQNGHTHETETDGISNETTTTLDTNDTTMIITTTPQTDEKSPPPPNEPSIEEPSQLRPQTPPSVTPTFQITNLNIDRRMIVNRQRRIKMYRCWIQGHFLKPPVSSNSAPTTMTTNTAPTTC